MPQYSVQRHMHAPWAMGHPFLWVSQLYKDSLLHQYTSIPVLKQDTSCFLPHNPHRYLVVPLHVGDRGAPAAPNISIRQPERVYQHRFNHGAPLRGDFNHLHTEIGSGPQRGRGQHLP